MIRNSDARCRSFRTPASPCLCVGSTSHSRGGSVDRGVARGVTARLKNGQGPTRRQKHTQTLDERVVRIQALPRIVRLQELGDRDCPLCVVDSDKPWSPGAYRSLFTTRGETITTHRACASRTCPSLTQNQWSWRAREGVRKRSIIMTERFTLSCGHIILLRNIRLLSRRHGIRHVIAVAECERIRPG